jgi:hypothetical protein
MNDNDGGLAAMIAPGSDPLEDLVIGLAPP